MVCREHRQAATNHVCRLCSTLTGGFEDLVYSNVEPTTLIGHEVIHRMAPISDRSAGTRAIFTRDSKEGSRLLRVRCDVAAYSWPYYQFISLCNGSASIGHVTAPNDASPRARPICRNSASDVSNDPTVEASIFICARCVELARSATVRFAHDPPVLYDQGTAGSVAYTLACPCGAAQSAS